MGVHWLLLLEREAGKVAPSASHETWVLIALMLSCLAWFVSSWVAERGLSK